MQTFNATPPPDFPDQVLILDRELAKRHPKKAFYLRLQAGEAAVVTIDLDGEMTLPGAAAAAVALGYAPSHWMDVGASGATLLPESIRMTAAPDRQRA